MIECHWIQKYWIFENYDVSVSLCPKILLYFCTSFQNLKESLREQMIVVEYIPGQKRLTLHQSITGDFTRPMGCNVRGFWK